jgi:hypothetical protein
LRTPLSIFTVMTAPGLSEPTVVEYGFGYDAHATKARTARKAKHFTLPFFAAVARVRLLVAATHVLE